MNEAATIKTTWLRLLLFLIVLITMNLIFTGFLPRLLSFTAMLNDTTSDRQTTVLIGGIVGSFLASLVTVGVFTRYADRKEFYQLGYHRPGDVQQTVGVGFALAILTLGLGTLFLCYTDHLQWTTATVGPGVISWLFIMAIVSFGEELVFRGYLLSNLLPVMNKWTALGISALIFALFHGYNPESGPLALANVFLAGLLLGINYIFTKNLWFGLVYHVTWNFFQGPVLGYPVSGIRLPGILQQQVSGSTLLTGGDFGFEASILYSIITVLAIGLLARRYIKIYSEEDRINTRPTA